MIYPACQKAPFEQSSSGMHVTYIVWQAREHALKVENDVSAAGAQMYLFTVASLDAVNSCPTFADNAKALTPAQCCIAQETCFGIHSMDCCHTYVQGLGPETSYHNKSAACMTVAVGEGLAAAMCTSCLILAVTLCGRDLPASHQSA